MGSGILAIWHDVVPEHEAEVLGWYDQEHHFERLAVPGFQSVRRYHAEPSAAPQLFIRYETEDTGTLSSPAYLERLNAPTPWTLSCQPQFRNNSRTVCERAERFGRAEGGAVVTVRLAGSRPDTRWRKQIGEIAARPGILGWEYWIADLGRSTIPTREKQLRGGDDQYVGAVLVVHAYGVDEARACSANLTPELPVETTLTGIYRLAFAA